MFGFLKSGPTLSPVDAVSMVKKGTLQLIDIRDISEVKTSGIAKGATHIPLMMVNVKADPRHPEFDETLDPSKPTAVYCASGARSFIAVRQLKKLGYEDVHNLGGLGHWQQAGGKIIPA
ncbi:MAG: rhodanese-like domain-containing protein [Halocynthiibacter sp.]